MRDEQSRGNKDINRGGKTADKLCVCVYMEECERGHKSQEGKKKTRALWLALDRSAHCCSYGSEPMMTTVTHS